MGHFTRMTQGPPDKDPFPTGSTLYSTDTRGRFDGFYRVTAVESRGWSVTVEPCEVCDYYQDCDPTAAAQLMHYAGVCWMAPGASSGSGDSRSIGIEPAAELQQEDPRWDRGDYALRRADGAEMFLWDGEPLAMGRGCPQPGPTFGEMFADLAEVEAHERRHFDLRDGPLAPGTILQISNDMNSESHGFLQVTGEAFRVGEWDSHVVVRPIGYTESAGPNRGQLGTEGAVAAWVPTPDGLGFDED